MKKISELKNILENNCFFDGIQIELVVKDAVNHRFDFIGVQNYFESKLELVKGVKEYTQTNLIWQLQGIFPKFYIVKQQFSDGKNYFSKKSNSKIIQSILIQYRYLGVYTLEYSIPEFEAFVNLVQNVWTATFIKRINVSQTEFRVIIGN